MDLDDVRSDATQKIYSICFKFLQKHLWGLPYSKFAIILCYLFFKFPIVRSQSLEKVEQKFQGAYDRS